MLPRLNPAQHRLLRRHVDRAIETLREGDRLLHGAVADVVERCVREVEGMMASIDRQESRMVRFTGDELPPHLVPYLDNPFAQGLAFNRFCAERDLSHTKGMKEWTGGNGAWAARNLVFLPPVYGELWEAGHLDKTRLVAIANRNLTRSAYVELADLVRTRRKEDVDEKLLKLPPSHLNVGRRGPDQALAAAEENGWSARFAHLEVAEELVEEAQREMDGCAGAEDDAKEATPGGQAARQLRAGLNGAHLAPEVEEALAMSPDPGVLVERFLAAHRHSGEPDPEEVSRTLFFAHAGPMQKLMADDKLLLRHFRPVKTQKRGQLFYRVLDVIEERLLEKAHLTDLEARGITEKEAVEAVREAILELNQDANRYLVIPDEWLGEVTRRHMYFGSRTRKDGAAYKWFRKFGDRFFLGGHKTLEELEEKEARRAAKASN